MLENKCVEAQIFENARNGSPFSKDARSGNIVGHTQVCFFFYLKTKLFSIGPNSISMAGPCSDYNLAGGHRRLQLRLLLLGS